MSPSSPTSPCLVPRLDQLTDLTLWAAELTADPIVVESALMRRLTTVPDRRSACGRRHPLVVIMTLTACATLVVGGDSVAAIWQWAARTSQQVLQRLGAYRDPFTGRFIMPSERTFPRVLADLDADALDAAISGYVTDVLHPGGAGAADPRYPRAHRARATPYDPAAAHPSRPDGLLPGAALDGKASRGARTTDSGRVFLVGAISHEHGVVLGQGQVADKRGEGPAARALLTRLDVAGMVLTLDALHTTKATARLITGQLGGHYVLILRGNQPLARAAARALLSGPDAGWSATTAIDHDHGHDRTERPSARPKQTRACSPAPGKPSGCVATSATWTASGPARRSCTASPACPPKRPDPLISTIMNARTGVWKTASTGSETLPSGRITPRSEQVPHPKPWPVSATWRSAPPAWPAGPTSPMPAAISSITTTPSPSTPSDQPDETGQNESTPGPWVIGGPGRNTTPDRFRARGSSPPGAGRHLPRSPAVSRSVRWTRPVPRAGLPDPVSADGRPGPGSAGRRGSGESSHLRSRPRSTISQ